MSRLILWDLITLDGFFEGPAKWSLDWHNHAWGDELERFSIEQLHAAEAILFGRVTYEGMASYWSTAKGEVADLMNAIPKVVFSRTLERAEWNNSRLVKTDAVTEVREMKSRGGRDLFVFGSADLSATFVARGLFDEYRLLVAPVVLGSGTPLFGRGGDPMPLKLIDVRRLATGGVILSYEPVPRPSAADARS